MNAEKQVELIKSTLEDMVGYKYVYGGHHHIINGYTIHEDKERVYVQTSRRHFDRPLESALEFLSKFEKYEERSLTVPGGDRMAVPMITPQITSSTIGQLKDVLLANIEKVKADKGYIPQATAVKQNVDSIIDLAKIEVAYMEAYVRVNKIKE